MPSPDEPANAPSSHDRGSLASRILRPIADVKPDEVLTAGILTLTVFLLLTAYYLLKTAREPLILENGGAAVKSYASAGQSITLVFLLRGYSAIARRFGRMKLTAIVYFFFVANLALFAAGAFFHAKLLAISFFIWVGIFSAVAIAQFWSFANDIYTLEQGKRIFAILGIGSSLGAIVGSAIAGLKFLVVLGPQGLMVIAGAIVTGCVFLMGIVHRRELSRAEREGAPESKKAKDGKDGKSEGASETPVLEGGAFKTLVTDKYLLLIASLVLVLNSVNSTGEYLVGTALLEKTAALGLDKHAAGEYIEVFMSHYFTWANVVGAILQFFAVSRVLKLIGVRGALFVMPIVSLVGYGTISIAPVLPVIFVAKIAENSLDYSLENTTQQALYLVATRVEKYVGKITVDSLIKRMGDVISAGVVFLGQVLKLATRTFALVNVGLVLGWLGLVVLIGRENKRREEEGAASGHGPDSRSVPAHAGAIASA